MIILPHRGGRHTSVQEQVSHSIVDSVTKRVKETTLAERGDSGELQEEDREEEEDTGYGEVWSPGDCRTVMDRHKEAVEQEAEEEERGRDITRWEREGWGLWSHVEQGWHEVDGEWKLLFTTYSGRREWLEEDKRRRVLVEGLSIVATPKRKREKKEQGAKGGAKEEGTPEKRQCLERKKMGGGSPNLRRLLVDRRQRQGGNSPGEGSPNHREEEGSEEKRKEETVRRDRKEEEQGGKERKGGGSQEEDDREMRKPERRLGRDAEEEEHADSQGAQEQTNPVLPSSTRSPGWLKPPTKTQKPVKKRKPRKPKIVPKDLTQRTIRIARRRKSEGGEGKGGGNEDRVQGGDSGEWMWGNQY